MHHRESIHITDGCGCILMQNIKVDDHNCPQKINGGQQKNSSGWSTILVHKVRSSAPSDVSAQMCLGRMPWWFDALCSHPILHDRCIVIFGIALGSIVDMVGTSFTAVQTCTLVPRRYLGYSRMVVENLDHPSLALPLSERLLR